MEMTVKCALCNQGEDANMSLLEYTVRKRDKTQVYSVSERKWEEG